VITADFNARNIQRHIAANPPGQHDSLKFVYVTNRRWHYRPSGVWLKIENSILKPLMNLAYAHWLRDALAVAKAQTSAEHFDRVHLITYVGFRFPGRFWTLGLPFVWGPVGGLQNTPWKLLPTLGVRGAAYYACRNLVNSLQRTFLRTPRRALLATKGATIAATTEIQTALLRYFRATSTVICEVGLPDSPRTRAIDRQAGEPLVISWSGRHLPGKAFHLLLRAVAALPARIDWKLEILGDGPCRTRWINMATELGIQDRCRWHGWLHRADCLEVMRQSHVFVITSLKDLTSTVSLEALSLSLPIICPDHCGFADLVTSSCGIKIPITNTKRIIADLSTAIASLWDDEDRRRSLAREASERSRSYSWPHKLDLIDSVYFSALATPGGNGISGPARPIHAAPHANPISKQKGR
jgi:glycosyltransferase involved in cell wall biosynthesis